MCSQKLPKILIGFFIFFILFTGKGFATAPQITAYPSGNIGLNQSFTVTATMSGLSKSSLYRLRVAFAQTGTTNYFGSTWNGNSWYTPPQSSINYANFYSITTDGNGAWWGDVQGEIDPDDPNFTTGSGTYDLKIGRYTQTGSTATWSNIVNVAIAIPPQPTDPPTPTPTITPQVTPITHSISPGYSTPTPKPPTLIPASMTKIPIPLLSPTDTSSFGAVLGSNSAVSPTIQHPTLVAAEGDRKQTIAEIFPIIFIIVGFCLLASCGILVFFQSEKGQVLWRKFF